VAEIDLYYKKVSIAPLRILYYPQADILVAERLELPHRLSKLIRILDLLLEGRGPHRLSRVVDLTCVVVGSVLGRCIIRPVRVVLEAIVVAIADEVAVLTVHVVNNIPAAAFCGGGVTTIIIVITIVALVVVRSLYCVRIGLGVVRVLVVERILETSASWCVNEFGRPAARVGLKEHDRG
jgi:hypothetical protein